MNRDEVLTALKAHERELRAAGVVSVSLFGSTARGEPDPGDVDIAVRIDESFTTGGFDYFWQAGRFGAESIPLVRVQCGCGRGAGS